MGIPHSPRMHSSPSKEYLADHELVEHLGYHLKEVTGRLAAKTSIMKRAGLVVFRAEIVQDGLRILWACENAAELFGFEADRTMDAEFLLSQFHPDETRQLSNEDSQRRHADREH